MGDADIARGILVGFQEDELQETLDELQENLNTLHLNLQELETRTLQHFHEHMTDHMRAYFTFRCLVIAINFVFVPVVMAVGLSCIVKELIDPNVQDALQGIIQILWMIAASLGASLYLGSMWALYNLPLPDRLFDEESSESSATGDDFDFFDTLMRQPLAAELPLGLDEVGGAEMPEIEQNENDRNEPYDEAVEADDESEEVDGETEESQDEFEEAQNGTEEAQNEVEGTEHEVEETENEVEETENEVEGTENEAKVKEGEAEESENESEKTADLLRNQEYIQNDRDLQPERSVTIISSAATEETDDTANKNDNAAETVSFQVEADPVTPKTAETVV